MEGGGLYGYRSSMVMSLLTASMNTYGVGLPYVRVRFGAYDCGFKGYGSGFRVKWLGRKVHDFMFSVQYSVMRVESQELSVQG